MSLQAFLNKIPKLPRIDIATNVSVSFFIFIQCSIFWKYFRECQPYFALSAPQNVNGSFIGQSKIKVEFWPYLLSFAQTLVTYMKNLHFQTCLVKHGHHSGILFKERYQNL